jgi:hypothetical protein
MGASIKSEEYYSLFWEYLKRSQKYKMFCETFAGVLPMQLLGSNELSIFAKKQKINPVVFVNYYNAFGNIHISDFKDWWEKNKQQLMSEKLIVSDLSTDNEFLFDLTNLVLGIIFQFRERNVSKFSAEDIRTIRKNMQNFFSCAGKDSVYLKLNINRRVNYGNVSRMIKKIVTEKNNIMQIPPSTKVNRLMKNEINAYLQVYDPRKKGMTYQNIIKKISTNKTELANPDDRVFWSSYARKNRYAKRIIKNIENGKFPGEYEDKRNR